MNSGTNSKSTPTHEGELVVFPSPHAPKVLLVDRAEKTGAGGLRWSALLPEDPVCLAAIAEYRAKLDQ